MTKKRAIIFGVGMAFYANKSFLFETYDIIGIVDNNAAKHGTVINGLPVSSPDVITALRYDVIINTLWWGEDAISLLLVDMGVPSEKIAYIRSIEKTREELEIKNEKDTYDPNEIRIAIVNNHTDCLCHNHMNMVFAFFYNYFMSYKSGNKICKAVKHYNPDIVLILPYGDRMNISKFDSVKHKIFYTAEDVTENTTLHVCRQYEDYCVDECELSMGFSDESNMPANYIRCEFPILEFFQDCHTLDDIKNRLAEFGKGNSGEKFCSMIARHDIKKTRAAIYEAISNIGKVDCPSYLFHNDDSLKNKFNNIKHRYLQQYKFNICPENTISKGYRTEKIWGALFSGCIPIYTGGDRFPEQHIINPDTYIWFDRNEPDSINNAAKEIKLLHENSRLLDSFRQKPIFCDSAVDRIYEILQRFKARLTEIAQNIEMEKNGAH